MLRHFTHFLLPAVILLPGLAPVSAQGPGAMPARGRMALVGNRLSGRYVNPDTGDFCYVYRMGRGYLFVDEAVQRVPFARSGAGRLHSVPANGRPVPDITVTVGQDGDGRVLLRFFNASGTLSGYWVSVH